MALKIKIQRLNDGSNTVAGKGDWLLHVNGIFVGSYVSRDAMRKVRDSIKAGVEDGLTVEAAIADLKNNPLRLTRRQSNAAAKRVG